MQKVLFIMNWAPQTHWVIKLGRANNIPSSYGSVNVESNMNRTEEYKHTVWESSLDRQGIHQYCKRSIPSVQLQPLKEIPYHHITRKKSQLGSWISHHSKAALKPHSGVAFRDSGKENFSYGQRVLLCTWFSSLNKMSG